MSLVVSPSTKQSYGVLRVTRIWGRSRASLYRHRRCDEPPPRGRPGPLGPMPDEALVDAIRELLAASRFHGEGYRKVWARLRFAGIRTSKRRVLRLMRAHDLLAPGRVGRPHGPKAHDGTIRTERVDEMWATDLTSTLTGEGQASIFITVDHASTECLGIHAARRATRFEALEPLRQSVRACFALHPDTEGEPALGPPLRDHRGPAPGPPRVQGHLQPDLDRRAPRLPDTRRRQSGATRAPPGCRMNPQQRRVSQLLTATGRIRNGRIRNGWSRTIHECGSRRRRPNTRINVRR